MAEFELTSMALADILSGRAPWPTEQELQAMSDKPRDRGTTAPLGAQTTRDTESAGVLGGVQHQNPPPADTTEKLDDGRVIQTSKHQPAGAVVEMYTPKEDVTETTDAGLTVQIATKGVPMPMAEAKRLGLVKDSAKSGPTEHK